MSRNNCSFSCSFSHLASNGVFIHHCCAVSHTDSNWIPVEGDANSKTTTRDLFHGPWSKSTEEKCKQLSLDFNSKSTTTNQPRHHLLNWMIRKSRGYVVVFGGFSYILCMYVFILYVAAVCYNGMSERLVRSNDLYSLLYSFAHLFYHHPVIPPSSIKWKSLLCELS